MRLQPVPVDELDEPRLWWMSSEARFRPTSDSRLSALRPSVYEHAFSAVRTRRSIKVATYVLANHAIDVKATHALLAQHAHERGWIVSPERFTDEPTNGPLPTRPQFHLAARRAGSGFVDGVLACGREAMPPNDEVYEAYLRWLRDRFAFIAFLQPTYRGTPCRDR